MEGTKTVITQLNNSTTTAAAGFYLKKGWYSVPVPAKTKGPKISGWQKLRITDKEIPEYFKTGGNIGIITGDASGGLCDIDLDCAESVAAAILLPATLTSGRSESPGSHWWFITDKTPEYWKASDLEGNTILEVRGNEHQTIVAPSVHPGGNLYRWENCAEPVRISGAELSQLSREVATTALLRRYWTRESRNRNNLAMATAGFLARRLPIEKVLRLIEAAAGDDEELKDRLHAASVTLAKLEAGQPVTGAPTLDQMVPGLGKRLLDWWGPTLQASDTFNSLNSLISQPQVAPWPQCLAPEAFHGLAGKIVYALDPHTEADSAALLTNLLVAAGVLFGDKPHFRIGGDKHPPRLFGILVGQTSKARKGSSWGIIKAFLAPAIEYFNKLAVSGLSSGEGLIWAVRDPIIKREPIKTKGRVTGHQEVETDPGVADKRLLVVETEFVRTLKVMGRDANILSSIIRQAWDDGDLRVLTKESPAVATAAHISILGHITIEELLRSLDSTESANGFANRFLWIAVKRSKCLPEGGCLVDDELSPLREEFKKVIESSSQVGEVCWSEDAKKIWAKIYPRLSDGHPGFFGSMIGRAETQVIRLSLIYALLDGCPSVKPEHLFAALAFWDRVEESVRHIFGEKTGYPLADAILSAIRNAGSMAQVDISNSFGRHQSAEALEKALDFLQEAGKIRSERHETPGRPATIWKLGCEISEISELKGVGGYLELAKKVLKELDLTKPPNPATDFHDQNRPEVADVQSPPAKAAPDLMGGAL